LEICLMEDSSQCPCELSKVCGSPKNREVVAKHVTLEVNADLTDATNLPELLTLITEIRETLVIKFPLRNITITDKTLHAGEF